MLSPMKATAFATLCAVAITFTAPATAMPRMQVAPQAAPAVEQVQFKPPRPNTYSWNKGDRAKWKKRDHRKRHHRHRNRSRDNSGWQNWVVPGIAGAIIGGAIAGPPRYYAPAPGQRGNWSAHVAWCDARYRSYRAYDDTFQPYNGPRRRCNSPYS